MSRLHSISGLKPLSQFSVACNLTTEAGLHLNAMDLGGQLVPVAKVALVVINVGTGVAAAVAVAVAEKVEAAAAVLVVL